MEGGGVGRRGRVEEGAGEEERRPEINCRRKSEEGEETELGRE